MDIGSWFELIITNQLHEISISLSTWNVLICRVLSFRLVKENENSILKFSSIGYFMLFRRTFLYYHHFECMLPINTIQINELYNPEWGDFHSCYVPRSPTTEMPKDFIHLSHYAKFSLSQNAYSKSVFIAIFSYEISADVFFSLFQHKAKRKKF